MRGAGLWSCGRPAKNMNEDDCTARFLQPWADNGCLLQAGGVGGSAWGEDGDGASAGKDWNPTHNLLRLVVNHPRAPLIMSALE